MPVALQPPTLADLLLWEADLRYSRDVVTIAAGRFLFAGTVLGQRSDGKCVALDPAATDGSQTAAGVLLFDTDAFADAQAAALTRAGLVQRSGLVWPVATQSADQTAALAALLLRGIVVREAI